MRRRLKSNSILLVMKTRTHLHSRAVCELKKRERSVQSWEEMMHESSQLEYQEKLIVDLLTLLKQDVAVSMGFVEPASKKRENTLPAD